MEMQAIKEMFTDDEDDENIDIKEEIERFFESEKDALLNQHMNFYQNLEPVAMCTEQIPAGNSIPMPSSTTKTRSNRIILGSKPNRVSLDQDCFDFFTQPRVNIALVDVQSYLHVSKRYCNICLTLFSDSSDYLNHREIFHSPKVPDISQNKMMASESIVYQCSTCDVTFSSMFSLETHNEQNHNPHFVNKPNNYSKEEIERSLVNICNKHNDNLSQTCFHCNKMFETQKFLIKHLYDILETKKNTSDITPVLKSILFKCHKCDINFVSLQVAECHSEHMEMLINWKCSICFRIFKKEDELNHERQHSVSHDFITYNLAEVDVRKILFKCCKCDTHFTENAFLYHFHDCEMETLHSVYCDICDIVLEGTLKTIHESDHCSNDFDMRKLTVIETEVISDNSHTVNEFEIRRKVNELEQLCSEVKVVIHRLDTNELYANMKSDIGFNKELELGLETDDTSSLIIDEIHNEEFNLGSRLNSEAMSPISDIVLRYDDNSDPCLDFEDIPQEINEIHKNKESKRMFECLDSLSSADLVLVYDESSSDACDAVTSKSHTILNNKDSEPGIAFFEPISQCSVPLEKKTLELNEIINHKESEDPISVLYSESSKDIPPESDFTVIHKETEKQLESFETNSSKIENIIISDDSDCEIIESELRTETVSVLNSNSITKSKNTVNSRLTAVDKFEKHRRLRQRKSFTQSNIRKRNFVRKQRRLAVSKVNSNRISSKSALKTDVNPTNSNKKPNLTYFYCKTCECFITKFKKHVHMQQLCKNTVPVVCTHCGLVSTSNGSLSHSRLHNKNKNLKIWNFKIYNINGNQLVKPPMPKYPICVECNVHFVTKSARINHICKGDYVTCNECKIKLSEAAFKLHKEYHDYLTNDYEMSTNPLVEESKTNVDHGSNEGKPIDNVITSQKSRPNMTIQSGEEKVISLKDTEIVYTCRNCCVTVDTYDKVIEHCQGHYISEDEKINTIKCTICLLDIDNSCYLNHHNMHEKGNEFKVLKFDSYYFPSENKMWINHVFKTVPQEKVTEILSKSIYRFEGRIKLDIVQQGPPELTVYKCDQCCCFIDPCSMYKHSDNSCFKLRHHLCTICNLPFNSAASQIVHEKIHERPGITLKSYRIVLFNQQRDKQLNSSFYFRRRYVLYVCRNCGGIIDKLQLENHRCDKNDLKKCPQCGLFLYSRDYDSHANVHEEFDSFNDKNMKVILLGKFKTGAAKVEKTIRSNFLGLIYDYRIYKCEKCQLCVRNENYIPKHSCHFEKKQYRCPKCSLHFSVSRLKTHMRNHERDSFYLQSNMTIVSFDPSSYDLNKNVTTASGNGDCDHLDSNTDSDTDIVMSVEEKSTYKEPVGEVAETVEEIAKLYKCVCGLHFLNEASITRHFGVCKSKSRASKQMCPKCNLLFSTNILFTHLLAHHSNKNSHYKYEIIEVAKE